MADDPVIRRTFEQSPRLRGFATVADFGLAMRVTPSRVYQMISSGELRAQQIAGELFVPVSEFSRELSRLPPEE